MPVLSPHRSSASALAGSYRSTFSSSSVVDRPYFTSSTLNPRLISYSERYSTRSYADSDGRRYFSRSGSLLENGVTTRFREETRESSLRRDSLSRDSGISSIRENSIADFPRRDSSVSREKSYLNSVDVLDQVEELRSKYSPSNYIPACLRERNENISRSKSINDIGLPPIEQRLAKKKVNDSLNYNNSVSHSNPTNDNMKINEEDDNGNRASVADLRKKFDERPTKSIRAQPLELETSSIKICENKFKQDDAKKITKKTRNGEIPKSSLYQIKKKTEDSVTTQTSKSEVNTKLDVNDSFSILKNGIKGYDEPDTEVKKNTSRVNNFASYIPSKDYIHKSENTKSEETITNGETDQKDENSELSNGTRFSDISTSPKLNTNSVRSTVSPSTSTLNSVSSNSTSNLSRRSTEKERSYNNDVAYEKNSSPVKTLGLNGLKNIGNTCFMNSVIQCLSNTKVLLEYTLKDHYAADVNVITSSMKGVLMKAFAEVIKKLWSQESSDRVVNTTNLKNQIQRYAPRFIGYSQQDAQEFLRYLLEGLHEDVNRVKEKPKPILTEIDEKLSDSEKAVESWTRYLRMDNSKIVDYFVGQLKSTLKCTHCGHCSVTFDPFWDLSLPIPQRAGQVRLSQCLDSFTREETLDGDEKPTCSKCKERRKCTKSFTIQKFPRILVIHLKRFSLAEKFRGKLSVTVDFPLEGLDMSHYAADNVSPYRYNLYAISNHSGTTYSGHYTAYCRHPYAKTWHEYNDSRVSSISSQSIVSGEAYVLFYEQDGQKSHL